MLSFILRRLLALIPLLLGITLLVFLLMYFSPGDFLSEARARPDISQEFVQAEAERLGLDRPWYEQYVLWLGGVLTGDFGQSWAYNVPVFELIAQRLGATIALSLTSLLVAWCVAIPLGILAAIYKDSIFDRLSSLLAYAALSIPEFFFAMLAVFFALNTGLFPVGGLSSPGNVFLPFPLKLVDWAHHLVLPALVLGLGGVAGMMRIMRSNFLDYMRAEFVTTARAKGLKERSVMFKHALRNAINPFITYLGFAFSTLLSGALLVEVVMNYPGLGRLIYTSIVGKDQFVVMGAVVVGVTMLVIGNLLADLLLAAADPRIRLEAPSGRPGEGGRGGLKASALVAAVPLGIILFQVLAPAGVEAAAVQILKWVGLILAFALALLCVAIVVFTLLQIGRRVWRPLLRKPLGAGSLGILGVLYLLAAFAPWVAPYDQQTQNLAKTFHPPTALTWSDGGLAVRVYEQVEPANYVPGDETVPIDFFSGGNLFTLDTGDPEARIYLLGSDATGRDIFSRLLYGARVSLSIGLVGISITMALGFLVGALSGYLGGTTDFLCMRLVEFLMAMPGLYLLLTLRSARDDALAPQPPIRPRRRGNGQGDPPHPPHPHPSQPRELPDRRGHSLHPRLHPRRSRAQFPRPGHPGAQRLLGAHAQAGPRGHESLHAQFLVDARSRLRHIPHRPRLQFPRRCPARRRRPQDEALSTTPFLIQPMNRSTHLEACR